MNKEEIIVLINATAISLNTIIGDVEFAWDGGQKGSYYICEPSRFTEESIEDINYCLDGLSSAVSKFLQENDLQEEDLWN